MRSGEDYTDTLFFLLFPPARLGRFPTPAPEGGRDVYVLLTAKGGRIDLRVPAVITRFSSDTMKLHRFLLAKIAIFIAMFFLRFIILFYYRSDTVRTTVISCLRISDPLSVLSSFLARGVYLLIYLLTSIFSRRESSPRVFSLKILSGWRRGELEFQIESHCTGDAPFSAVNCILDVLVLLRNFGGKEISFEKCNLV